jgi:hypothetical protein
MSIMFEVLLGYVVVWILLLMGLGCAPEWMVSWIASQCHSLRKVYDDCSIQIQLSYHNRPLSESQPMHSGLFIIARLWQ